MPKSGGRALSATSSGPVQVCKSQNMDRKQATLVYKMYKVNSNPGSGETCQRYLVREEVLDGSRKP